MLRLLWQVSAIQGSKLLFVFSYTDLLLLLSNHHYLLIVQVLLPITLRRQFERSSDDDSKSAIYLNAGLYRSLAIVSY